MIDDFEKNYDVFNNLKGKFANDDAKVLLKKSPDLLRAVQDISLSPELPERSDPQKACYRTGWTFTKREMVEIKEQTPGGAAPGSYLNLNKAGAAVPCAEGKEEVGFMCLP